MHILEAFSFVCLMFFYESGTSDGIDVSTLIGKLSWTTRIMERYLEFEDIALTECARECMRRKRCQSFNYCKVLNYCELSDVTRSDGTPYTNRMEMKTFVHSDINTWSKTLSGECEVNNCDMNSSCDMISGSCNISDLTADRIKYGNHYFLFVNERVTWLQAVDLCHKMHGVLAEPKEKGMSDVVAAEAVSRGRYYWIGGIYNSATEWIWQSNGEQLSYTNWRLPYQIPWNGLCISLKSGWYQWFCEHKIYYICQQSLSD